MLKKKHRARRYPDRLQPGVFPSIFDHCKSIKKLVVRPHNGEELLEWIKRFLSQFSTAETILVGINAAHYQQPNPTSCQLALISTILDLEQYLGVHPHLSRVSTVFDWWEFVAPKGHTLKWKES
jgi:hypothetical protein